MPITVLYCADCTPPKLLAAGDCAGASHEHEDGSQHAATAISDVDELVPEQLPHTTADGTIVNTYEEWLTHLEGYLP
jgi:hypothetical protein